MLDLVILVPMLGRPHTVAPLVESIREATPGARALFLVSPGDDHVHAAVDEVDCERLTVPFEPVGDYARKINTGYRATTEPLIFTGACDILFHRGWFEAAMAKLRFGVGVVGTNDLGNPRVMAGQHATHFLVTRAYANQHGTIDQPGAIFHEGYPHEYCNPPEAPVWMGDLTFRSLGDVRVGDQVMGWERFTPDGSSFSLNRLCTAEVLAISTRQSEIVRVSMESGRTFRCTPDHRWYNAVWTPSANKRWVDYPQWVTPKVGRTLMHVADMPPQVPPDLERMAGWLGGIYDGEGSWIEIAQCPVANPEVHAAICAAFGKLDITYTIGNRKNSHHFTLTGGRQGYLNFLLRCQPVKRHSIANKIIGGRRFGLRDKIVSVEPDGAGDVVSMTTTTGNYVAWGYASKNCDNELIGTAKHRGAWAMALDSHVEHLHPHWGKAPTDAIYDQQSQRMTTGRVIFNQRRRLWRG
jgi:hypothetical protein